MPDLPNFDDAYGYENGFYLSCHPRRMGKLLAHYELYKMILDLPGAVVECGIFKGASFARFSMFRNLFETAESRKMVGFDIFGVFPETNHEPDQEVLKVFLESAGSESYSKTQIEEVLRRKGCEPNTELIPGDITSTVPIYARTHPEFRIALLNLDVDVLEPNEVILNAFWDRMVSGGVLVLDDYGIFPGATKAVDDFFESKGNSIKKFPYANSPSYIVK